MPLTDEERIWIEDEIIWSRLPNLKDWRPDEVLHEFGANDLDWVEEVKNRLNEFLQRFKDAAALLSDQSVAEIREARLSGNELDREVLGRFFDEEFFKRRFRKPPAQAYGFGHATFRVDFDYWSKMYELSPHEFTMLSIGAYPKSLSKDHVFKLSEKIKKGEKLWASSVFLAERSELIHRYFHFTGWGYEPRPISHVKSIIDQIELDVPSEFYTLLDKRFPKQKPVKHAHDEKNLGNQEKETLLKLIAAMACEQYGYDPDATRSPSISNISDDLDKIGQSLDKKTIRKWLKEGANLVDEDYWHDEA